MKAPDKYLISIYGLRKLLYTLFVGAILIGLLWDEISLSNWKFLLTLSSLVLFIDISILLTPSIMKFWHAEFNYPENVQKSIKESKRLRDRILYRVGTMSEMIQNVGSYIQVVSTDEDERIEDTETFINEYCDKYGLNTKLFRLTIQNVESEQALFRTLLGETLEQIDRDYGLSLSLNREENIDVLFDSSVLSVLDEGFMILPVYMDGNNLLAVIESKKGEILEVDAVHITNLIFLYHSFTLNL